MISTGHCSQPHQVSAIFRDEYVVMVNSAFVPSDLPLQCGSRKRGGDGQAIINSRLDFSAFLIVIPGYQLKCVELVARVVKAPDFSERLQPGFATLLTHHSLCSPSG